MSKVIQCDVCGLCEPKVRINKKRKVAWWDKWAYPEGTFEEKLDVCDYCWNSWTSWIKNRLAAKVLNPQPKG